MRNLLAIRLTFALLLSTAACATTAASQPETSAPAAEETPAETPAAEKNGEHSGHSRGSTVDLTLLTREETVGVLTV